MKACAEFNCECFGPFVTYVAKQGFRLRGPFPHNLPWYDAEGGAPVFLVRALIDEERGSVACYYYRRRSNRQRTGHIDPLRATC